MPFSNEYVYLPLLVLAFLYIDLSIEVGSIRALALNIFFWLYWVAYSVAAGVALYFVSNGIPALAKLPEAIRILVAIVGTTTVLQSLTFKVGGRRVLDLSHYLDDYRRKVLSYTASLLTKLEGRRVLRQTDLVLKKLGYQAGQAESEEQMRAVYAEVMLFGARKPETVQKEILKIQADCDATGAHFGRLVARRVAQTDPEWVRNLLTK
jgi:hypothetical protein